MTLESQVGRWREETPGLRNRVHLNNAGSGLMPAPVIAAIREHLELEATIGGYEAEDKAREGIEATYDAIGRLIGAPARNVAVVENATVAMAQALSAFDLASGDRVITTDADYGSNQLMLLSLARRRGIEVVRAAERAEGGADPDSIEDLLRHPRARLVVATWVPSQTGLVQEVEAIGERCAARGVPFVLDACQAVGQIPVDVGRLRCDFLGATARKFLRGPRGIGFLYVSDQALSRGLGPLFPDISGARWTAPDAFELRDDARRFENWEFAYALLLGMGAAARYALEVGVAEGGARAAALAAVARERLGALTDVRVLDRGPRLCAIATFGIRGREIPELVRELRRRGVNTSSSSSDFARIDLDRKGVKAALRVSPHYYNDASDLDALVVALQAIPAGASS